MPGLVENYIKTAKEETFRERLLDLFQEQRENQPQLLRNSEYLSHERQAELDLATYRYQYPGMSYEGLLKQYEDGQAFDRSVTTLAHRELGVVEEPRGRRLEQATTTPGASYSLDESLRNHGFEHTWGPGKHFSEDLKAPGAHAYDSPQARLYLVYDANEKVVGWEHQPKQGVDRVFRKGVDEKTLRSEILVSEPKMEQGNIFGLNKASMQSFTHQQQQEWEYSITRERVDQLTRNFEAVTPGASFEQKKQFITDTYSKEIGRVIRDAGQIRYDPWSSALDDWSKESLARAEAGKSLDWTADWSKAHPGPQASAERGVASTTSVVPAAQLSPDQIQTEIRQLHTSFRDLQQAFTAASPTDKVQIREAMKPIVEREHELRNAYTAVKPQQITRERTQPGFGYGG